MGGGEIVDKSDGVGVGAEEGGDGGRGIVIRRLGSEGEVGRAGGGGGSIADVAQRCSVVLLAVKLSVVDVRLLGLGSIDAKLKQKQKYE